MKKIPYEPVIPETLDDINFLDVGLQNCPYHAYQKLRDEAPVWLDPKTGFYVITRFDDMRNILLDPKNFINGAQGSNGNARSAIDEERAARMHKIYETKGWVPEPTLAGRDDPNHKQMRAMFNEAFRPARIKALDPLVESTARKLIGAFIDDGHCDWVHQFAVPLPLTIIGHIMGVEKEEDLWQIKAWTDSWMERLGLMQTEKEEARSVEAEIEAQHYFQPIFERLRKEPDDSLLSELVNRVIPEWGRPLNDNELHAEMMADSFAGGAETSSNAIAFGIKLLIENPNVWDQLKSDPDNYLSTFVEEAVRLECPVQGLFRATVKDMELHGVKIPAGSTLNIRYAAANRDEREFEAPEKLDLERKKPGRHIAFGSGIHHCLGAPLARRELYWSFKVLVENIDEMWFAPGKNDFTQSPNFAFRSLKELHIEFKKAS